MGKIILIGEAFDKHVKNTTENLKIMKQMMIVTITPNEKMYQRKASFNIVVNLKPILSKILINFIQITSKLSGAP